ncbi:hypothetical protein H4R34_001381 [Dimargaris verticillata]|uniref:Uncharacterized protein n=1 Tax=Dimargaris verticillata TaxID=2761393 RepID=A0A9W8EAC4_9FUNG|nr:hypothetical protein H4R34_001381 [Dimargaris verticillata]
MSQPRPPAESWTRGSSPVSFKGTDSPCEPRVAETVNNLDYHFRVTRRLEYIRSGVDTLLSAAECLPPISENLIRNTADELSSLPPNLPPPTTRISVSSLLADSESESDVGDKGSTATPLKRTRSPSLDPALAKYRRTNPLPAESSADGARANLGVAYPPPRALYPYGPATTARPTANPSTLAPLTNNVHPSMITISCFHAMVAQKSYGSEKRFLCPPPMVMVRESRNGSVQPPNASTLPFAPELSMTVVNEQHPGKSSRSAVILDQHGLATCKQLHVANMAKSKFFKLRLVLPNREDRPAFMPSPATPAAVKAISNLPYATFESAPISIISKPSKKTAKARNISSCILSGSSIALFNRINSQTVRTKFLCVEQGVLCARNSTWTSFTISLVNPPATHQPGPHRPDAAGVPITYGSEVFLTDPVTGVQSEPMIIRKVEKGRLAASALGPVSQMQKIAFQKLTTSSARYYLSSATNAELEPTHALTVADLGYSSGPPTTTFQPFLGSGNPAPSDITPPTLSTPGTPARLEFLSSQASAAFSPAATSFGTSLCPSPSAVEDIDDKICWTVVGIARFDYSFMETEGPARYPITQFPNLSVAPKYHRGTHSLELQISNPPLDPAYLNNVTNSTVTPLQVRLSNYQILASRATVTTSLPAHFHHTHLADGVCQRVEQVSADFKPVAAADDTGNNNGGRPNLKTFLLTLTAALPSGYDVYRSYQPPPLDNRFSFPIQLYRPDGVVYDTGYDLVYDNSESLKMEPGQSPSVPDCSRLCIRVVNRT